MLGGKCAPFFQNVTETMPLLSVTVVGLSVIVTGAEACACANAALETQHSQIAEIVARLIRLIGLGLPPYQIEGV